MLQLRHSVKTLSLFFRQRRLYATKSPGSKKGPSQVKEVILSWLISKNDLETQKRKAIESILKKGNKLQLRLENRNKKFYKPNENELEARQQLLEKVGKLVEEAGGVQAKPPQGSLVTRMMLFYQKNNEAKP